MANNKQPEGRWVTIRGRRVFISEDNKGRRDAPMTSKYKTDLENKFENAKKYDANLTAKYNHAGNYKEITNTTWQDRDADKKEREIAARQKERDERNDKSIRQRNIEALGLDEKKVNDKLIKDYEAKLKEASNTKDVNKKAELNKWLSRNEKSYNEAKGTKENNLIKESKKVFTKLRGLADNKTNDYQGTIKAMFKELGGTVYVRVRGNTLEYDGNVNGRKLSGSILRGEENYRYNMLAEDLAMAYYRNNGGSIGYTPSLIEKFGNK